MDKKETVNVANNGHTAATVHDWSPVDESGRPKSSQEIETDIEETRHSMDLILDALNGKANPGTLYRKAYDYFQSSENRDKVKNSLSKVTNSVSSSFQRNPLPVMMVAAGASWMLWEMNQPSHDGKAGERMQQLRSETGQKTEAAKERAGAKVEALRGKAGEASESLKERTGALASEAKEKAGGFFDQARQRGDEFKDRASELQSRTFNSYQRADSSVRKNPLLLGFAAACAGIVAGLLIPETRTETHIAEEKTPEIKQKAEKSVSEVSEIARKLPEENVSPQEIHKKTEETFIKPGTTERKPDVKAEVKPANPGDTKTKP